MKKLLFALIMSSAAVTAFAQDASSSAQQPAQETSNEMQPVAASDLPAAVTTTLQGQDYTGWTISNAYKKEKDGKVIYKVELKNGAETKTVKLDADGNKLKGKDKDKDKAVQ